MQQFAWQDVQEGSEALPASLTKELWSYPAESHGLSKLCTHTDARRKLWWEQADTQVPGCRMALAPVPVGMAAVIRAVEVAPRWRNSST